MACVALRVLADVGEGLADGGEHVLEDAIVDRHVQRPGERQCHLEADDLVELAHEVADVVTDSPALVTHPELVDRGAHLRNDPVDL